VEYIDRKRQRRDIRREQQEWEDVHHELIAVQQQQQKIQKKSLEVNHPDDPDEREADEVSRKVMNGESSEIHGSGSVINRKGSGAPPVTSDFQSQLNSSKDGGQSLPEDVQQEMGSQMGADLSAVKVHTGPAANKMSESINAKAFTHGQDIYFGAGHSPENKELLAHELVHTVQSSDTVQRKIFRQKDPATIDDFEKIIPSVFGQIPTGTELRHEPDGAVLKTYAIDMAAEATWKSPGWFYVTDMLAESGYVSKDQFKLLQEETEQTATASKTNFVLTLGGTLFIQATDVDTAFQLAWDNGMTPNAGEIFWYTDGIKKPYPISYTIYIADPTQSMVDEASNQMNVIDPNTLIPHTSTITSASLTLIQALEVLAVRKNTLEEGNGEDAFSTTPTAEWSMVAASFATDIDYLFNTPSKRFPDLMLIDAPTEGPLAKSDRLLQWAKRNNVPLIQGTYAPWEISVSPFDMGGFVFEMTLRHKVREQELEGAYQETNAKLDLGSLEWYIAALQQKSKENEALLNQQAELITDNVIAFHDAEITTFYQPYTEKYKKIDSEYRESMKAYVEEGQGWYDQQMRQKAVEQELEKKRAQVNDQAITALRATSLGTTIESEITTQYTQFEQSIISGNLTIAYQYNDTTLNSLLSQAQQAINQATNYSARDSALHNGWAKVEEHLRKNPTVYSLSFIPNLKREYYLTHAAQLLFNPETGELSVYAIKEWADRNLKDIKATQKNAADTYHEKFNDEMGRINMLDMPSISLEAHTDFVAETNYGRDYLQKIVDHPENDEGFWEGFASKQSYEYIPFIHSLVELDKMHSTYQASNLVALGAPIMPTEEILLTSFVQFQEINRIKEKPRWYKIGEMTASALTFMGEFILTAPVGGAVVLKVTDSLTRALVLRFGQALLKRMLVKVLVKGTGLLAGSLFQTLANPLDVMRNIVSYGMPIIGVEIAEDGSYTVLVGPSPNGDAEAIWKGFITSYVEVFTERLGGAVIPFLGKGVKRFLPGAGRFNVFVRALGKVNNVFGKVTGFHGFLNEYEEEIYAQLLDSLLKGEHLKMTWDQQIETIAVIAIIGGTMKTIQGSIAGYQLIRSVIWNGKKIQLPEHIYLRLCELVGEEEINKFKIELEQMTDLSPDQKMFAAKLADYLLLFEQETAAVQSQETVDQAQMPQNAADMADFLVSLYEARGALLAQRLSGTASPKVAINLHWLGESEELTLYTDEQIRRWILDTERAITGMEGYTVAETKTAAGIDDLISHNVELWKAWKEGWRPAEAGEIISRIKLKQLRLGLPEELRQTFDKYRLPDETATQYLARIQMIEEQGRSLAQFLKQNKSNIDKYRLPEQQYNTFADLYNQRPDAEQVNDPLLSEQQRQVYEQQMHTSGPSAVFAEVESAAINAEQRFHIIRQIMESVFGKRAMDSAKGDSKFLAKFNVWRATALSILRNPQFSSEERAKEFDGLLSKMQRNVNRNNKIDRTAFDFETTRAAMALLSDNAFTIQLSMDDNGVVYQSNEAKGHYADWIQKVKEANNWLRFNGIEREYVLAVSEKIDGAYDIMILSRQVWNIKAPENVDRSQVDAPQITAPFIVDIGAGISAYGVDMTTEEDLSGTTLVNTEYGPTFIDPSLVRSDLTWKNAAPRTNENTVVIFGNPLQMLAILFGKKTVKTLYINNINAYYTEEQYEQLALGLLDVMAQGGTVEVQWDTSSEYAEGPYKSRGHIEGDQLNEALKKATRKGGRNFSYRNTDDPVVYPYSITPSRDPNKPPTLSSEELGQTDDKKILPPKAENMQRGIFTFE
jgi:hypothetical protein